MNSLFLDRRPTLQVEASLGSNVSVYGAKIWRVMVTVCRRIRRNHRVHARLLLKEEQGLDLREGESAKWSLKPSRDTLNLACDVHFGRVVQ